MMETFWNANVKEVQKTCKLNIFMHNCKQNSSFTQIDRCMVLVISLFCSLWSLSWLGWHLQWWRVIREKKKNKTWSVLSGDEQGLLMRTGFPRHIVISDIPVIVTCFKNWQWRVALQQLHCLLWKVLFDRVIGLFSHADSWHLPSYRWIYLESSWRRVLPINAWMKLFVSIISCSTSVRCGWKCLRFMLCM